MNDVISAASAASTALPPARSTSAPALAVSGCPAATTPRDTRLEAWDELGHVDVGHTRRTVMRIPPTLSRARDARLADRLAQRGALGPRRARLVVARGHDGHPDLVLELLVDHGAEDDVGVRVRGLLHLAGGL